MMTWRMRSSSSCHARTQRRGATSLGLRCRRWKADGCKVGGLDTKEGCSELLLRIERGSKTCEQQQQHTYNNKIAIRCSTRARTRRPRAMTASARPCAPAPRVTRHTEIVALINKASTPPCLRTRLPAAEAPLHSSPHGAVPQAAAAAVCAAAVCIPARELCVLTPPDDGGDSSTARKMTMTR